MPREHTSGPWTAIGNEYQDDDEMPELHWEIQSSDGTTVVETVHGDTSVITERFDAALIAEAPNLLEELMDAASECQCGCGHSACRQCARDKRWRATIERALGHNGTAS